MDLPGLVGALEPRLGPLREGPEPLTGGITNHNFRARFGDDEVVLRVAGADTDLLGIDRGAERQATEAAAALGIAAPVLAFLPEASCLVTRWVAGTPLDPAGVRARLVPVARALRAFHDGAPPLPVDFDVPRLARDYLTVARGHGSAPPPGAHDAVAVADRVVAAIAAAGRREHAPVPCHDDLLPANLIADGDRIWIVDWEYAGMGDRFFDLGNLAVNNDLTREQEAALLEAYFESPATPRQLAVLRLMRAVSDVREALWGVVQGALSDVRFDFDGYAAQHLVRLARTTARRSR